MRVRLNRADVAADADPEVLHVPPERFVDSPPVPSPVDTEDAVRRIRPPRTTPRPIGAGTRPPFGPGATTSGPRWSIEPPSRRRPAQEVAVSVRG